MPVIAYSDLPSFKRLQDEGQEILSQERAESQDIREIHIGILNMMQDTALEATERQFLRLIGNSSSVVQIYIHFLNISGIERGPEARTHIGKFYKNFDQVKADGLDGLIITGANITQADITKEAFWPAFCDVLDWAKDNVTSVMCSCLATHAAVKHLYNIDRKPFDNKLWGVYSHVVDHRIHPLMYSVNTKFFVPHSRNNSITKEDFEQAGAMIIVESEEAGVNMAASADGFRFIFFQGHPEYDTHSLLKEYKREVQRYIDGARKDYPPFPENYFSLQSRAILDEYQDDVDEALKAGKAPPAFPEKLIEERLENIWGDSAKSLVNNWINQVYQLTHMDRKKPFMDGIDPEDPLSLRKKRKKDAA